jgi:hypothetical protein
MNKPFKFKVLQIGVLPTGDSHAVTVGGSNTLGGAYGARARAIEDCVGHFYSHRNRDGGYVGIAPAPYGMAVQLHAPDGEVEAWRLYRIVTSA